MNKLRRKVTVIFVLILMITATVVPAWAGGTEPNIKASSAIICCGETGEVIWAKNPDEKMEPASMTKLMTCLLAVENLDLDQVIEIPQEVSEIEPTKIYLQPGEEITVENLLYAALLPSANDAATALGIAVAGSVEDFAVMMNERASELGCKNTNFVNPSGLSAEEQYSTVRDIAIIAEAALGNDTIRSIAGTATYTIPATNAYKERQLESTNLFLEGGEGTYGDLSFSAEKYDGVFGGKTGSLSQDYCTMVTGLDYDGFEIYTVIMGTDMQSRFSDMKTLMDYGEANISKYVVFDKGEAFGTAKVKGGATNKVEAIAADSGYVNLPEGASASLVTTKCKYSNNLTAPISEGQKVGQVEIYIADELYRTVDLVAASGVKEGWVLSRWGITNLQTIIICVITGLIVAFVITILVLRIKNKRKYNRLRKEKLRAEAMRQLEREEDLKRRNWPY